MAGMSDFLESQFIIWTLRPGTSLTFSQPTHVYVALYTTMPNDAHVGGVEVTGGSYARQEGTFDSTGANSVQIVFPTASADWGTVVGVGIYDHISSGNFLFAGALSVSRTIRNGDTFRFDVGNLKVTPD